MKRLLPLLALSLLAGCATYPQYGYYDDARYERYSDVDDYRYNNDGGDYYYSTQPDYSYYYDDGYYGSGYGGYGSGYGYGSGSYGYDPYGYAGYGYGGYGSYGGYGGYGYRPGLSIGLGYSFGNSYRRGSYPYYYGSGHRNHDNRRSTRGHDDSSYGRRNFRNEGDRSGPGDNDASRTADRLARERGVRDAEPRSYRVPDNSRESAAGNGWRSDYRDAQMASPRAAASGGFSRSASGAPQLRMEPIESNTRARSYQRGEQQSLPRTPPVQTWRAGEQANRAEMNRGSPRGRDNSSSMAPQRSYAPAPNRGASSSVAPRAESRGSQSEVRSSSSPRSRDAEE